MNKSDIEQMLKNKWILMVIMRSQLMELWMWWVMCNTKQM